MMCIIGPDANSEGTFLRPNITQKEAGNHSRWPSIKRRARLIVSKAIHMDALA